eukprot:NODE_4477_length_781_cov_57.762997_g4318_i0.p1 GENE.NODE_4477_length_781_cov_57.762997_g4318_i0~~NODE_4477_length_781_cov_57.762997_g4318_i0.p1  ORF type:complete len:222 (-),score=44.20 NODE_4477_length_781_cov_57.762997_g4318_i0:114-746(-)
MLCRAVFLLLCVVVTAKPSKIGCDVLSVKGFTHNEWMNTWTHYWRVNASCMDPTDVSRRCYSKMVDPIPQVREFLAHMGLGQKTEVGNVGYMKWSLGKWYITSQPDSPSETVYAQVASKRKAPPSTSWEVYNGTAMASTPVRIQCLDGTTWLTCMDLFVWMLPAFAVLVGLFYVVLIGQTVWELGCKLFSRKQSKEPAGEPTPSEAKKED